MTSQQLLLLQEGLTIQANGRWQQIKLLRAEWAHPRTIPGLYSRVLYITNLTPVSCTWRCADLLLGILLGQHLLFMAFCQD